MIQKFQNKQTPNLNMLFLNLYIRRSHLVIDSLAEVSSIIAGLDLLDSSLFTGDEEATRSEEETSRHLRRGTRIGYGWSDERMVSPPSSADISAGLR